MSNRSSSCCRTKEGADVRDVVRSGYAKIAQEGHLSAAVSGCSTLSTAGGCCGTRGAGWSASDLAEQIGYSAEQVASLPEGANMGLSCGNPTAIAAIAPGETVIDLGSGGGFDCFLAGPKVGHDGRVIGIDMTAEMIAKARRNIAAYEKQTGLRNVEFRLGEIEHLPVADQSVDVVISNCVLNLSPDKPQVWREIARVLRPGGRVAVSDMALLRPLPESVQSQVAAMVGCVAGAVLIDEYRQAILDAGLVIDELRPKPEYVAALRSFKDPLYARIVEQLPAGTDIADFVTSIDVQARRVSLCCGGSGCCG
jgi:SAM-dependent methyltransferase